MAQYSKQENVLKRAEELIKVGKPLEALHELHVVITSKRHRAWTKTSEKIMFKYIELCVEMRMGRFAKDGLIQYRIVCQQVNVASLEDVIKHFMHLSTERAETAKSQAEALEVALDVDDLEADKRPEDLMLSFVSGEKGKDRSDRELVTPWFKFLWETYRTVLEILRNNSKLESLYAMTAHRAFQFCKQYKRTTEFRRLCEIIRNHLANLNKYRDQRDRPDISAPESLQLYLDTRFEQLKVATELELWQEAFRSVEDIHGLMCLVKKTPKASLMVVYYAKLTEIFWVSGSHLYHAYSWCKLFSLQKSFNKNLSQKDLQLVASSVVLAALSVPPYDKSRGASHMELEHEKERNLRMANLIGFIIEPKLENREVLSRSALLSELVTKGVFSCATQEVKDLYHLLENESLSLDLASRAQPLLNKISKLGGKLSSASSVPEVHLSQYIPALEKLATLRLLQQVSQVYQTMKIDSLSNMIPFFDFSVVEKISVDAVRNNFISMKIDHMKGVVKFVSSGLDSDEMRDHLMKFAEAFNLARAMIFPPTMKASRLAEILPSLAETVEKEHKRNLARKSIIEQRKEEQEHKLLEIERDQEAKKQKVYKETFEAEQKRLAIESEQRKAQKLRMEIQAKDDADAQALFQNVVHGGPKKKGKKPIFDREKMTKQALLEMAQAEQIRERQEMEKKLQKQAKNMDHFERARREEATPLIHAAFEKRLVEEQKLHEHETQQEVELSRQRHDGNVAEKYRLFKMLEHKMHFQMRVMNRRQAEFDRLRAEKEERKNQTLQQRHQERVNKRKIIFFLRAEEERLNKVREEEEARKREEAERKKKEEAEKQAKLDAIFEKQRRRELELEEKERLRKASESRPMDVPPRSSNTPVTPAAPVAASAAAPTAAAPTAAAPTAAAPTKYVPRHLRGGSSNPPPAQSPPSRPDDRWGGGSDSRRPTWSSARNPPRG